jgi:hypothetical protein
MDTLGRRFFTLVTFLSLTFNSLPDVFGWLASPVAYRVTPSISRESSNVVFSRIQIFEMNGANEGN